MTFGCAAPEGGEDTGGGDKAGWVVGELVVRGGQGDDGFRFESKSMKIDYVRKGQSRDDMV